MPGLGFSLSGALAAGDTAVSSAIDGACTRDYLMIPCGSDVRGQPTKSNGVLCAIRFCGSTFNSLNAETVPNSVFSKFIFFVSSKSMFPQCFSSTFCMFCVLFLARSVPYELRYFTNGLEAGEGEQGNLGFCLTYQQLPCPASVNNFNFMNMII